MKIIVDNREKKLIELLKINSEIISKKYEIKVEALTLGDVLICDENDNIIIMIERKTISDLNSSIKDGRYSEQSFRLNNCETHNHNIIYLIEGNILNNNHRINNKTIYSSLLSLNYMKGFSVFRSFNIQESTEIILRMFDKLVRTNCNTGFYKNKIVNDNVTEIKTDTITCDVNVSDNLSNCINYVDVIKNEKKANITPENINIIMLCQIPNISTCSAKAILEQYDYKTLINNIETIDLTNIKIKSADGKERKISKRVIDNLKKYLK